MLRGMDNARHCDSHQELITGRRSWLEYSVMAFLRSEGLGIGKNCSFLVNVLAKYKRPDWIRCVLEVDALSNDNLVLGGDCKLELLKSGRFKGGPSVAV